VIDTASRPVPSAGADRAYRRPPVIVLGLAAVGAAFFVVPLAGLVRRVPWTDLWSDLTSPEALTALRLSLVCSLSAAALSVLFGLPLAWVLARARFRGRALLRGLVLLPLVLPPVVGGVALLSALSRRSTLGGWLYDLFGVQLTFSTAGTILAETFVALPFLVITVEAALRSLDPRFEEVASSLGAGRATVFARVTLPSIRPALVAGAVLAWARALGEFGATITFAGNIEGRTRTLPLAVYLALESDPGRAVAMSLVLLAIALVVLVALRHRWLGQP
jgi:molybdate transport system permease protein